MARYAVGIQHEYEVIVDADNAETAEEIAYQDLEPSDLVWDTTLYITQEDED